MIEVLGSVNAPGARVNEDRVGHARFEEAAVAFVIDGATGVAEQEYVTQSPGSDAAWLADTAASLLMGRDPSGREATDYFADVLTELRARYTEAVPAFATLAPYAMPSATITWMRTAPGGLEFARQGDCTGVVVQGESAQIVGFQQPGKWETQISEQERARLAEQADDKGRIHAVIAELRQARSQLNQPGGYSMLGIEPAAARGMIAEHVPLTGEALVLLASDGLWRLVDAFCLYDAAGLVRAAVAHGLDALVGELRAAETADAAATRAPRVKVHDDASGLLLRIRP